MVVHEFASDIGIAFLGQRLVLVETQPAFQLGGCNVENASYGLSVCAERHAIAAAVAAGENRFEALAVVTDMDPPASPCGACRQVLVEFGDLPVILANPAGERVLTRVSDLLPDAFTPDSLLER